MTDILKLLEPAGENATDDIIRQIRFLLDSGDLQPGDKLPAERKLAEKFQVARSQVREAFKKLEFYNIIKTMPQSGSVISAIESTALNSLISDILKMDNASILTNKNHLPLIYALAFGMPGIPCVYYGSEWGAEGRKEDGDPALRPSFEKPEWNDLTEWISKLAEAKKQSKSTAVWKLYV